MKIEEQVLSIEQMKRLNELGLKVKDTVLCWDSDEQYWASVNLTNTFWEEDLKNCVLTLTLQEILELLPEDIIHYSEAYDSNVEYHCNLLNMDSIEYRYTDEYLDRHNQSILKRCDEHYSILENAYDMLCWVLENGYLKTN